jgi:polysaccharide biosynthesis/export protein
MPVKTTAAAHANHAVWLIIFVSAAIAFGQTAPNSQPTSSETGSAMTQVSPPLHADATRAAGLGRAFPSASASKDYKIGIDDVLTVNVWHEAELSRNVTVRPDGKVSLPLVGEIQAAGKTAPQLEAELRAEMAQFVKDPELTVIVAEIRSLRVNIIGQVVHPGTFAITQQMGVLDIIAEAGGLKDFAKKKQIYVLRETSAGIRVRMNYNYRAVLSGKGNAQDILLQANDTVIVP